MSDMRLDADPQKLNNDSFVKETGNCTLETFKSHLSLSTGAIPKQTYTEPKLLGKYVFSINIFL